MRIFIIIIIFITGCSSNNLELQKIVALPEAQQQAYLSRAKSARFFGFSVFATPNGSIGVKGDARLHQNHNAETSMLPNSLPVISISGKNKKNNHFALLDTGSPDSWMEFSTSQKIKTDFLAFREQVIPYQGGYNTQNIAAYAAVAYQLRIDQLFMENVPLYIRMATGSLGPQARGINLSELKTVLGYDVLKTFSILQFDYNSNKIRFASSDKYKVNNAWLIGQSPIINHNDRVLVVEGSIFGKETPVVLDLAGNYHLALPKSDDLFTRQLSFGNLVFRKIPTIRFDGTPRAGYKLFDGLIVTICPQESMVYFEKPQ